MNSSTLFNFIRQTALLVTTTNCVDKYLMDFDFFDGACFKTTLSKCLGLGIILGSIMVKLPQIIKIYNKKSGQGISLISVTLDLTAITIYASYSYRKQFPFSSWGDAVFLAIQTVLIGILVLFYEKNILKAFSYLLIYLGILYYLISEWTSLEFLWTLQSFNIIIIVCGKLAQALTNYNNGHTGQLSAITLLMLFLGSLARIFTSFQETGDTIVILTYVVSTAINAVLVIQLLYYWNIRPEFQKKIK